MIYGQDVDISLQATDPLIGTLAHAIAESTIRAAKNVQVLFNEFRAFAEPKIEDINIIYVAEYQLGEKILQEVLLRSRNIDVIRSASAYNVQIISIATFLCMTISGVFLIILTARQICDGYLKRLKIRQCSVFSLLGVKLVVMVLFSIVMTGLIYLFASAMDMHISLGRFLFSSALLGISMYCIITGVVLCNCSKEAVVPRTLLISVVLIILMMFAGGGFYPTYLMDYSIKFLNPAWMIHLLIQWSMHDIAMPLGSILAMMSFSLIVAGITGWRWRRFGC
jgi:ABC-type multidrug transport system permease subunit